jgi:hypothetical protein
MSYLRRGPPPNLSNSASFGTLDGFDYVNTSYVTIGPRILDGDDLYSRERDRAINHKAKEGVISMTPEELAEERQIDWEMIKKFSKKILSMDLTKFSFPVGYSEPRSFLERTCDLFAFLCFDVMDRAYFCGSPEMRLTTLATGIIAGFHLYLQSKKPWNPVLGETYVAEWGTGFKIFAEQISHHPPMSAFQIFGRQGQWVCSGRCNFRINSGLMQVDVVQGGVITLKFDDGTEFQWEFPTITVLGIVSGERYVKVSGELVIKDVTNDLVCSVEIAPKKPKVKTVGLEHPVATTVYGGVLDGTGKKLVSILRGDYCGSIFVDDEEVWNIKKDFASRPLKEPPEEFLLPSDCRFRIDRAMLLDKRMDDADRAKVILEEMQRREEKLRRVDG